MTDLQKRLYWREWGAVRRWCISRAMPVPDRHELHRRALDGRDVSSTNMLNADFDQVLAAFRAISQPDSLLPQIRANEQPKTRLKWRIAKLAPPNVTAKISRDKFGTADLDELDESQLNQLRNTLARWANRVRHRAAAECPF